MFRKTWSSTGPGLGLPYVVKAQNLSKIYEKQQGNTCFKKRKEKDNKARPSEDFLLLLLTSLLRHRLGALRCSPEIDY